MGPAFAANLLPRRRRARAAWARPSGRAEPHPRGAQAGRRRRTASSWATRMQPVRVALTGSTVSEPVNELLAVVGRDDGARAGSARSRASGTRSDAPAGVIRRAASSLALAALARLRRQPAARRRRPRPPIPFRPAPRRHPPRRPRPPRRRLRHLATVAARLRRRHQPRHRRRCPTACRPTAGAACSIARGRSWPGTSSSATSKACSPTPARRRSASGCARRTSRGTARRERRRPVPDTATVAPGLLRLPHAHRARAAAGGGRLHPPEPGQQPRQRLRPGGTSVDRADPRQPGPPPLRPARPDRDRHRPPRRQPHDRRACSASPPIPTRTTCWTSRGARRWSTRSGRWWTC